MRNAKILRGISLLLSATLLSCSSAAAYFSSINFGMMLRDTFGARILQPHALALNSQEYKRALGKSDPSQRTALLGPIQPTRPGEWAACDDFQMISYDDWWAAFSGGGFGRDYAGAPLGWNGMMGIPIWALASWKTFYFSGKITSFRASIGVADDRIVFSDVIDANSGLFTEAAAHFLADVPGRRYENILENGIVFSQIRLVETTLCPGGVRIFHIEGN